MSAWWVMRVYNVKAWFCALNCAQKINATAAGRLDASEAWIHFTQQPNKLLWCEAHSRGSDVLAVFLCHNAGWLEANTEGLSHHDKKPNRGAFSELYFVFLPPLFPRLRSRFSPEMQPLPERCVATGSLCPFVRAKHENQNYSTWGRRLMKTGREAVFTFSLWKMSAWARVCWCWYIRSVSLS